MSKIYTKSFAALAAGVCLYLSGCFSIQSSRLACSGEQNLMVVNYGWYLFNLIPLFCGNANQERILPWAMFRNDVTMEKLQTRFMDRARTLGAETLSEDELHDITYTTHSSVLFNLPLVNIPVPVPYLLTYKEIQISGMIGNSNPNAESSETSKEVK